MGDFPLSPTAQYTDTMNLPKMAQGYMKPATPEDIEIDETGITKPNLHRRIDTDLIEVIPPEVAPDIYEIFVSGNNSYRTIVHNVYNADSDDTEVP